MKNSTLIKGTAAIAVGAALLLGGGGTLAAWNAEATATPGTIVSGDLNVTAAAGVWTDRAGATIDISTYKVVPGDKLTYTQTLTVKLVGNKMAADITLTGADSANNFTADNVIVSALQLKNSDGTAASRLLPVVGSPTQAVTASTSFEFKSATGTRSDINTSYNLGNVKYTVQQVVAGAGLVAAP
ncbi:alternate-type signal peptide domain-containing protein [Arthrobacter globiformis]|uniref:Alternate-type signal peptide domain-containing protein n=1 Tax=Arthrobacter globiformis TaxID=1665 RepID=A0A328HB92_ARTGO|nr:alternate-type signal peptide domain-containing protein [Arthrobacter globiformis]RAM35808.1 alternate-type signal peptide domain-containing protein [Arthrobacter globiformis]